jgi:hypothetical protein
VLEGEEGHEPGYEERGYPWRQEHTGWVSSVERCNNKMEC